MKVMLVNVAVAMSQGSALQPHPGMGGPTNGGRLNSMMEAANAINGSGAEGETSAEELDAARTREINTKAVSGILLLLLKWFKVSRKYSILEVLVMCTADTLAADVLKFEYLTQLLLDCNYVPVLLKLWAHQDVQQLVDSKTDRLENR